MKQTPILFSTEMVQAILEGRKTQTRRVVKKITLDKSMDLILKQCQYGQPGDILWVRETWCFNRHSYVYKADHLNMPYRWKPSIHMPREACRLFLRIKSVRMERLHDISYDDAIAEGVKYLERGSVSGWKSYINNSGTFQHPILSFSTLWQSINGPESWDANPWVWVVEFERIEKP